jgi:hypothetical protein
VWYCGVPTTTEGFDMADISTAIALIGKVAAPAISTKAKRTETVGRILSKLGLQPGTPPADFEGLYIYALVEYGIGKNRKLLGFLRDVNLRAAFRRTFETGDATHLNAESQTLFEIWEERAEFEGFDYDPRQEVLGFITTFSNCLMRSRTGSEVIENIKLDRIQETLDSGFERLLDTATRQRRLEDVAAIVVQQIENALQNKGLSRAPTNLAIGVIADPEDYVAIAQPLQGELSRRRISSTLFDAASLSSDATGITWSDMQVVIKVAHDTFSPMLAAYFTEARSARVPILSYVASTPLSQDPQQQLFLRTEVAPGSYLQAQIEDITDVAAVAGVDLQQWIVRQYRRLTAQLDMGGLPTFELDTVHERIRMLRAVTTMPLIEGSAVDVLYQHLMGWFRSLGYEIESQGRETENSLELTIQVPTRRGHDRVLVRAFSAEVQAGDVAQAIEEIPTTRCTEFWLVANSRVSAAARSAASGSAVYCYTFDELIEQDADFEPYFQWLDAEVKARQVDKQYIPLACQKPEQTNTSTVFSTYDSSNGWMDGYVDRWLDDPSKEHISILGEFGTGKSWFSLHYAWTLSKKYRECKRAGIARPRLPLFIPLRDYAKAVSVESLFAEFFFRKHKITLPSYAAFEQLNRAGKLLLIFDGFDEMAARVDRQAMVNNFWELAKVVTTGAKAILTCRSEHFPTNQEERAVLSAELRASTAAALTGEPPQFEQLHILTMNIEQVRQLLSFRTEPATVEKIVSNPALLDLLSRPVMSELILDALPEVEAGEPVTLVNVYMYAIRRKMDRDIAQERTFTSLADKVLFLCELSFKMYLNSQMSVNYREFPETIKECFGARVAAAADLDHWHHDMLAQTILIRNSVGDYSPAHRSFLEFFIAFKVAACLGILPPYMCELAERPVVDSSLEPVERTWQEHFDYRRDAFVSRSAPLVRFSQSDLSILSDLARPGWTGLVNRMVAELARVEIEHSVDQLKEVLRSRSSEVGGLPNLLTQVFDLISNMDPNSLRHSDFSDADWTNVSLNAVRSPSPLDLSGVILRRASLRRANFADVVVADADFSRAQLEGVEGLPYERNFATAVSFQHSGRLVAQTSRSEILSIDLSDGSIGRTARTELTTLSASGRVLVTDVTGVDPIPDAVQLGILDVETLSELSRFRLPSNVSAVGLLADRKVALYTTSSKQSIHGVRITDGEELWEIPVENLEEFKDAVFDSHAFTALSYPDTQREDDSWNASLKQMSSGAAAYLTRYRLDRDITKPPSMLWARALAFRLPDELKESWLSADHRFAAWAVTDSGAMAGIIMPSASSKMNLVVTDSNAIVVGHVTFDGLAGRPDLAVSEDFSTFAVVLESLVIVFLAENGGLKEAWRISGDSSDGRREFTAVSIDRTGQHVAIASRECLISVHDARSGEKSIDINWSKNYRGAVFAGSFGLSDGQRDDLRRLGAVLE